MTKNEILKKFVTLYWLQLSAWVPLFVFAVWVAANLEALQSYLSGASYQISYFTSPALAIGALFFALFIVISQLRLSLRALKSESSDESEETAHSLAGLVKLTGMVVTPVSTALIFTAPAMLASGIIGLATLVPLSVGLAISLRATALRKKLEPLLEPRGVVEKSSSWFDDVPSPKSFAYHDYSSDPAAAERVPDVEPLPRDPAVVAKSKMTNVLFGSLVILGINLLFLASANTNYAPGGIGVANDLGLAVFDFILIPFALYNAYAAVDLLGKGGKWYLAAPAAVASIISLFIVPIA